MAYIGNTVQTQGFTPAIDYFNGNGVTVTFTLSRPVASVAQMIVAIDNVIQNPNSSFTVSGNAITFSSAPLSGTNNIWVEYTSLITTYNAISQDPTVIGDIRATGGYLAEGDFGNSYVDGTILDYVTGNARITTGPADGLTIYNGGTSGRTALLTLNTNGALGVGTSPSYGSSGQYLQSTGSSTPPTWATVASSQWTTTGSDIYYNTGNVGIGQSSITRAFANYNQLNISGSSGSTIQMQTSSTINANIIADGNGLYFAGLSGYMVFATGGTGAGTERVRIDSAGNLFVGPTATQNGATSPVYAKNTAKAWVQFVGSSGSVNQSFNVSSVTRNATGTYTVNYTSALANANPTIVSTINGNSISFGNSAVPAVVNGTNTTTTSVLYVGYTSGGSNMTANDYTSIGMVAFD